MFSFSCLICYCLFVWYLVLTQFHFPLHFRPHPGGHHPPLPPSQPLFPGGAQPPPGPIRPPLPPGRPTDAPPKPAFPAYQNSEPPAPGPVQVDVPVKQASKVPPVGEGCKLVHPEDDLSMASCPSPWSLFSVYLSLSLSLSFTPMRFVQFANSLPCLIKIDYCRDKFNCKYTVLVTSRKFRQFWSIVVFNTLDAKHH